MLSEQSNTEFQISDSGLFFATQIREVVLTGTAPEAAVPYPDFPTLNVPPKISADASTMAIEVNGEVQVFRLRE